MSEEMLLKLKADCNSLNAIASLLRHIGINGAADCLLSIESHIFKLIDCESCADGKCEGVYFHERV